MPLEILRVELATGVVVADRYRLERVVGHGGMGVVWAATHVLTGKACALKFLNERRSSDARSYERLLREARAACAVRHPNVAQVHDILELPSGAPFIVMDLLLGEPLSARLAARGRFSLAEAEPIFLPIIDAVAAAHALGIVHRDLKPDNVFLERTTVDDEIVKVLDFGIAKVAATGDDHAPSDDAGGRIPDASSALTSTYSTLGTPRYMAPEQLARGADVDARADVWAIGVIAFECLTGETPRADAGADEIARALRAAEVPQEVTAAIARMLSTAPEGRPTLAEVREVIARSLKPRGSRALLRSPVVWVVVGASAATLLLRLAGGAITPRTAAASTTIANPDPAPVLAAPSATVEAKTRPPEPLPSESAVSQPAAEVASSAPRPIARATRPARSEPGPTLAPTTAPTVIASAPVSSGIPTHERK